MLDARRDRAQEIYLQYLRHVIDSEYEAVGPLLDDVVSVSDGPSDTSRGRSAIVTEVARWATQKDVSAVTALVQGMRPTVRSLAEMRRGNVVVPRVMRQGDWLVEPPNESTLGFQDTGWIFRQMVVRWIDGQPAVVGVVWNVSRMR